MLGMDKALAWMFRCSGLSPSGSHIDKYFAITAIILIIGFPLKKIISLNVANSNSEEAFVAVIQVLQAVGTVGLIISNWMEPDKYMNIIKDLESIGNQVQNTNYKPSLKTICLIFAVLILAHAAKFYENTLYLYMYMFVAMVFVNGPSLQHMVMVKRIQNRLSALNDLLEGIAIDPSRASTELDSVFQLHSSLHALVVDVDLHFCFFNLFNYISKFIFCVIEMYGYLVSIENDMERINGALLVSFLKQVIFFISQALVCHACAKEANRTVLLAHRVLQPDTPLDLWEQVGLFSALAVDNKVYFTVIFTLDQALITQTALTALSYLIIAIQLREIQLF